MQYGQTVGHTDAKHSFSCLCFSYTLSLFDLKGTVMSFLLLMCIKKDLLLVFTLFVFFFQNFLMACLTWFPSLKVPELMVILFSLRHSFCSLLIAILILILQPHWFLFCTFLISLILLHLFYVSKNCILKHFVHL